MSYGMVQQYSRFERSDRAKAARRLLEDAKRFATEHFAESSTDEYPDGYAVMAVLQLTNERGRGKFTLRDVRARRSLLLARRRVFDAVNDEMEAA